MESTSNRNRVYICLILILVTAFGLRFWGVWFGLPYLYGTDEHHEVFRALELGSGSFNFERTGKGGYYYILFVEYGVLFVALKLAGIIASAQDFAAYFVRDQSIFYLIGRTTTAVIGTLNVYLLYRMGSRAYSTGAGILAAVFLTFDFLNAEHSHFITVDIPMTCLATAALLFAVRMATDGGPGDYKWAALFAALATTTKIPAVLLLVPLLIAHGYYVRGQGGGVRQLFLSRDLWWAAGIFIVVLAITNPGLFMYPPIPEMFSEAGGRDIDTVGGGAAVASSGPPNLFAFYIQAMADSMGWPLMLVCLTGVLYALWKHTAADIILVSFASVFYVVFSSSSDPYLYYPRYILPVIVVLALMAGRLLSAIWPAVGMAKQAAAVVVVAALVVLPAYRTVANNYLISQTDTRTIAKEWIENNIPEGATVFIEGLKVEPTTFTVQLRDTPSNIRHLIEFYETREPGKAKYLRFKLQDISGVAYDLELVSPSELRQGLEHYKAAGIEYLVIRPEAMVHSRKTEAVGASFLNELRKDADVTLVKRFRAHPYLRPGPDIDIYRVDSNVAAPWISPQPSEKESEAQALTP